MTNRSDGEREQTAEERRKEGGAWPGEEEKRAEGEQRKWVRQHDNTGARVPVCDWASQSNARTFVRRSG